MMMMGAGGGKGKGASGLRGVCGCARELGCAGLLALLSGVCVARGVGRGAERSRLRRRGRGGGCMTCRGRKARHHWRKGERRGGEVE